MNMIRIGSLVYLLGTAATRPCSGFEAAPGGGRRARFDRATPAPASAVAAAGAERAERGGTIAGLTSYNEFLHGYTRAGAPVDPSAIGAGLSLPEIHDLMVRRMHSRRARDFRTADSILRTMNERGIRINDRLRQWYVDAAAVVDADPDMRNCRTLEEMVRMAHDHPGDLSPRALSAFWTLTSKFLHKRGGGPKARIADAAGLERRLGAMLVRTRRAVAAGGFGHRDLATTSLGLAKIVKLAGHRRGPAASRVLRDLILVPRDGPSVFHGIAGAAARTINKFDARCLSNVAYAFAVAGCAPALADGTAFFDVVAAEATLPAKLKTFRPQELSNMLWAYASKAPRSADLFERVGDHIVKRGILSKYNGQDLANMVWAYATAKASHPGLFKKVARHILAFDKLNSFNGQDFANVLWAYSTAREASPELFHAAAEHIVRREKLTGFNSQNIANTAWAYATAGEPHPALFQKIADHVVGLQSLDSFNSQGLANVVWAYATANESHPALFDRVADHVASLDDLDRFAPQALSNTAWAFAKAREERPDLFEELSAAAVRKQRDFSSQNIGNFLWACAKNGCMDRALFESFAPSIAAVLGECNDQERANIAWAYSVAYAAEPSDFDDAFVLALRGRQRTAA